MDKNDPSSTILIVEDEPAIREICRRVLTREGYTLDFAEDGRQAQELITANDYALFLVDMRTPIIDGQELYVWLLQEKPHLANRVIFTTGDLMGGQVLHFISNSGKPFLPKPFTGSELKNLVEKTLTALKEDTDRTTD